jgi:hypothetical protein
MPVTTERRHGERRHNDAEPLDERQMRCTGCGTIWYSAVAETVAPWARCVHCRSQLHTERRAFRDRRIEF